MGGRSQATAAKSRARPSSDFERNLELVDRVRGIADEKGVGPGQLAIAWVLQQGHDVVPIPGTRRRAYLEENAAGTSIELSGDELARIEEVAPRGAAAGERDPAQMMRALDR